VSTQYGPAISSPSLRHVILAITASELPKVSFAARAQYHKQRAVAVLIQKLQNSATIQEADVSAAMLLAEFAYDSHRWSEVVIHMEGFISMMKLGNGTGETALHRFAPLVAMTKDSESFCNAVWFLLGVSPGHPSFGSQLALFRHRRCYWDTLRPFCLLSETSQAPISLLGLIDALEDVLVLSICCIRRIAAEDGPNYLEPLSAVEECLNHNDAELQELQSTVQSLKNSERISSKIDVEMHLRLTTLALPLTQCIQLARILKSPDGLGSPEAASMATLMLSSVRSRVLYEKSFDYHSDQLWFGHALLLAGMTLPREDVEKCTHQLKRETLTSN
jgi:hypothetical protein